jgi:hypothetical protein
MTRRLKCRIDREQSLYTCVLPEHKPVQRGREMTDLLAVKEPKPRPANSYDTIALSPHHRTLSGVMVLTRPEAATNRRRT